MARDLFAEPASAGRDLFSDKEIGRSINDMPPAKSGKDRSFLGDIARLAENDPVIGGIEGLLSMITGSAADPVSGYAGMIGGAPAVKGTQEALTYQPRTRAGTQIQQAVGDVLAPVGEAISSTEDYLGEGALGATGSPAIAAAAATLPTAAMELLGLKGARKAKKAFPKQEAPDTPQLRETGIRATAGEASQDLAQQKAENFLLEQSSEGGEQLRGYKLAQSREIKNYLEGVAPDQVDNVGESIKDALRLRESSAKFKRKQAYDKLSELTKDVDIRLNTDVIKDALPESGDLRDFAGNFPNQYNTITNLLTEYGVDLSDEGIKRAVNQGFDIQELSVGNAERMRKRLNNIEKADPTGNTSRIVGPIKDALDSEFSLASKALQESGSPDISRAAKEARQSHAALKTEFDEKGLTKQLIDTKGYQSRLPKIEDSQVYSKLMSKSTPLESFDRVVSSLDRAASKGKRAKSQIKSQMIMDLIDSGFSAKSRKINGEQIFGANAFSKRFDDLEPKLKAIMTKSEFSRLKKLRDDAQDLIPPSGALPKGSAGFFIDALDKAGLMGMMSAIPYAGPATAELFVKIGKNSQDARALTKAMKTQPEAKEFLDLIRSDYPSLGVALGIPQLREEEEE